MDDDHRRNPQSAKRWRQRGPAGEAGLNLPVLIRRPMNSTITGAVRWTPTPNTWPPMRRLKAWWLDNQLRLVDYTPGPMNL